jgi:hypothetical protein
LRRDLERRFLPIETHRYKSPRVVAVLRLFDTMPEEELARQIAWPSGVFDPRTMSYSELETLLDELRRRSNQNG